MYEWGKKRKANVKRRCQPCIICFNGLALLDFPMHWMKFHNVYHWLAFKLWWTHVALIDKCFTLNSSNSYIDIEFMFALHERKITIYRSIDLSSCPFICIMLVSSKHHSNLFISTFPTNQGKILLPMNKKRTGNFYKFNMVRYLFILFTKHIISSSSLLLAQRFDLYVLEVDLHQLLVNPCKRQSNRSKHFIKFKAVG